MVTSARFLQANNREDRKKTGRRASVRIPRRARQKMGVPGEDSCKGAASGKGGATGQAPMGQPSAAGPGQARAWKANSTKRPRSRWSQKRAQSHQAPRPPSTPGHGPWAATGERDGSMGIAPPWVAHTGAFSVPGPRGTGRAAEQFPAEGAREAVAPPAPPGPWRARKLSGPVRGIC